MASNLQRQRPMSISTVNVDIDDFERLPREEYIKSGTITTTTNSSTTAVTISTTPFVCSSSPATYYQYTTVTPPQCLNYTTNTDATRNIGYTASINYCDNISPFTNATSVWIRFQEPAGTVMANSPVPPNYCGTVVTGWYAGQYPPTVFTTVTSIVCFYYGTNTCSSCTVISVTNCQTFNVFLLPQPHSCNYRYCTL
ncbi:unnamed protein product [Rotaria sordida]|uniref:Uncharacterized protein n=3 Tax=Rotaria sordida TaxID=392033 RepID=A0A813NRX0_9BILA|nr:unnamed protein product [Rotaria sordida]CAF0799087.1 unnamed protein product [Rotaria sordida]